MADYLQLRRPLHGVVLMIDSRLGFTDLDKRLLALMAPRLANGEVRLLAVLTKADKLNRSQAQGRCKPRRPCWPTWPAKSADIGVTLFSALKRARAWATSPRRCTAGCTAGVIRQIQTLRTCRAA
jgi:GTP-binding protein